MCSILLALNTLASLASVALASPASTPYLLTRAASCASPQSIQFHFNDTSLGTTTSCTADVMDRGPLSPATRRRAPNFAEARQELHLAARETTCADGPNTTYVIKRDDTLEKIAAQFSSGVCNIAVINNLARNPDFIIAGVAIIVPTNVCPERVDNTSCRTPAGTATCVVDANGDRAEATHTIVSGDTFTKVANDLGITPQSLIDANPGVVATNLQVGQVINVPICK